MALSENWREQIVGALLEAYGYLRREAERRPLPDLLDLLREISAAIGRLTPATSQHDAGAYARCSKCGRFTADPAALVGRRRPACDCGAVDYWCGSFAEPGPTAQWSIGVRIGNKPFEEK